MSSLPPIRYPLPILLAIVLVGLLAWRGAVLSRSIRSALAAQVSRALEGPPLPHSERPQVVAGPITRRALLLHDEVDVAGRPGGPALENLRRRMFVDIYDVWPLSGNPTHYRIGNRKPLGWVRSSDLLSWNTRLVIRAGGRQESLLLADTPEATPAPVSAGPGSLPVLESTSGAIRVAVWDRAHPWSELDRTGWIRSSAIAAGQWGVWLSREEVLALLRRTLELTSASTALPPRDAPGEAKQATGWKYRAETVAFPSMRPSSYSPSEVSALLRLRTVIGRLLDERPLSEADLRAARVVLPAAALEISAGSPEEASDRLARLNERWPAEASWGGVSFAFVPLEALP